MKLSPGRLPPSGRRFVYFFSRSIRPLDGVIWPLSVPLLFRPAEQTANDYAQLAALGRMSFGQQISPEENLLGDQLASG